MVDITGFDKWRAILCPRLIQIAKDMNKEPVEFRISDDTWWDLERGNDEIYSVIEHKWRDILKEYSGKKGVAIL